MTMPPMPRLSVVLPCYNEARGLRALVERYAAVRGDLDLELVLVDNGSTDDTQAVLAEVLPAHPWARCHRVVVNRGYGDGIRQGLESATGEWLAWSHADLQTDPADVIAAFRVLVAQPDPARTLVKGHRHGRALAERVITWGMEIMALALLHRRMTEINAQPKVFHRSLLDVVGRTPDDFNFDVCVLHRALLAGWSVRTIPVRFPPRQYGHSNWSRTFASRWRTIRRSMLFMARLGQGRWP
ncbi:MAG: hypothetical protein RLZZ127_629 [Planctomycetota bacterium]|jgi:glycosyltransferase involved in cell wall biosynthesis